ncbi:alpha/beta hydrolase [Pseudonocardia zijingensis]|uniref:Dienelactone hydrolase family protein n=1 Tax=Pseudonocardia zijingensis TaxID=153376 RepID=A0ABP3ZLJ6_9PSEU
MTIVRQSRNFDVLGLELGGDVAVPESPIGVVVLARGPGGRDDDERDLRVSNELGKVRVATVRVNLLTTAEQRIDAATAELRFDANLLGVRTIAMIDRLASDGATAGLPGGLLGAHSAAAGCLIAAAARPQWVRAVVSPSGRPDLAGEFLLIARAPTLLVVGEYDTVLRERNEVAADRIAGPTRVALLDDVGHLIDEPGAQALLAEMCRDWFRELLRARTEASAQP